MKTYNPETMIEIKEVRARLSRRPQSGRVFSLRDMSGDNWHGYDYAITCDQIDQDGHMVGPIVAESHTVFFPNAKNQMGNAGAFAAVFYRADILDVLQ